MEIRATQKYIVESPKKLREVAYLLRGTKLSPTAAIERFELVGKRAAGILVKVIKVAVANAKVANLNPDELIFKEILINEGPVLKRFRAGSRGRAKPYKKRMSHIRIVLGTNEVKKEDKKGEDNKLVKKEVNPKKTEETKNITKKKEESKK